jgi:hypothetical protein
MKVCDQKVVPQKTYAAPNDMGAASTKTAPAKATHAKSAPKASVVPWTSVPLKDGASYQNPR